MLLHISWLLQFSSSLFLPFCSFLFLGFIVHLKKNDLRPSCSFLPSSYFFLLSTSSCFFILSTSYSITIHSCFFMIWVTEERKKKTQKKKSSSFLRVSSSFLLLLLPSSFLLLLSSYFFISHPTSPFLRNSFLFLHVSSCFFLPSKKKPKINSENRVI